MYVSSLTPTTLTTSLSAQLSSARYGTVRYGKGYFNPLFFLFQQLVVSPQGQVLHGLVMLFMHRSIDSPFYFACQGTICEPCTVSYKKRERKRERRRCSARLDKLLLFSPFIVHRSCTTRQTSRQACGWVDFSLLLLLLLLLSKPIGSINSLSWPISPPLLLLLLLLLSGSLLSRLISSTS